MASKQFFDGRTASHRALDFTILLEEDPQMAPYRGCRIHGTLDLT